MPQYLIQVAYTSEAIQALIKHPQSRSEVVRAAVEKLGGQVVGNWASFGDYDTIVIVEMPSNIEAAAIALAVSGGGSCKSVKTTPLLTVAETLEAMKRAGGSGYQPVAAAASAK
jgi:uncharacterized protein with GYD domain